MYDRPKGNFSFLIAFAKQLAQAIDSHRDDDVGYACESLAASLALLDAVCGESAIGDDGGPDEGVESDDSPGDDTALGAALARIAELEHAAATAVDQPRKRRVGGATTPDGGLGVGGKRPGTAILNSPGHSTPVRRGSKRRGKK